MFLFYLFTHQINFQKTYIERISKRNRQSRKIWDCDFFSFGWETENMTMKALPSHPPFRPNTRSTTILLKHFSCLFCQPINENSYICLRILHNLQKICYVVYLWQNHIFICLCSLTTLPKFKESVIQDTAIRSQDEICTCFLEMRTMVARGTK